MSESIRFQNTQYLWLENFFQLEFFAPNLHVYTQPEPPKGVTAEEEASGYLVIDVWGTQETVDHALDPHRRARPTILLVLSILSYLVDFPLTVYQFVGGKFEKDENSIAPSKLEVVAFVHQGIDKSNDLLKILQIIYWGGPNTNSFVASLLNRWHKARYLEEDSEAGLFSDESFLAYFHILELLSSYYEQEQRRESDGSIKTFVNNFSRDTLKLRGNRLEQEVQEKSKAIHLILLADGQIPIYSKICYFLDKVGLLDGKTQSLVERLIKIRNSLAHGRQVYRENLDWPLPPFFPIDPDAELNLVEVRILSACAIACHLKIKIWMDVWVDLHSELHPPIDIVKDFISKKLYQDISTEDFLSGRINGVRPSSIVDLFLLGRLKTLELEQSLEQFLLAIQANQENAEEVLLSAILLADSDNIVLSSYCQHLVKIIHANDFAGYSNLKDVLRYLNHQNITPKWFREWIRSGEYLKTIRR